MDGLSLRASLFLRLLGRGLFDEVLVDVRQDTTTGDGSPDQGIQFLVSTDGELQVSRGDTLDSKILRCVTGQFEDFRSQVLEDGGTVNCGLGTDPHVVLSPCLEVTVNSTDGELKTGLLTLGLLSPGSIVASLGLAARLSPALACSSLRRHDDCTIGGS